MVGAPGIDWGLVFNSLLFIDEVWGYLFVIFFQNILCVRLRPLPQTSILGYKSLKKKRNPFEEKSRRYPQAFSGKIFPNYF